MQHTVHTVGCMHACKKGKDISHNFCDIFDNVGKKNIYYCIRNYRGVYPLYVHVYISQYTLINFLGQRK